MTNYYSTIKSELIRLQQSELSCPDGNGKLCPSCVASYVSRAIHQEDEEDRG